MGVLFLTAKPVTEKDAQRIATQEVSRSAEQLRFDASVFRGPELIDVQQWGYAFQWGFSDQQGPVDMLVWVVWISTEVAKFRGMGISSVCGRHGKRNLIDIHSDQR